jgi:hypothetical protein
MAPNPKTDFRESRRRHPEDWKVHLAKKYDADGLRGCDSRGCKKIAHYVFVYNNFKEVRKCKKHYGGQKECMFCDRDTALRDPDNLMIPLCKVHGGKTRPRKKCKKCEKKTVKKMGFCNGCLPISCHFCKCSKPEGISFMDFVGRNFLKRPGGYPAGAFNVCPGCYKKKTFLTTCTRAGCGVPLDATSDKKRLLCGNHRHTKACTKPGCKNPLYMNRSVCHEHALADNRAYKKKSAEKRKADGSVDDNESKRAKT